MKSSIKNAKESGFGENKGSIGVSGGITYSTLANVPKAKRTKLIAEANPMVSYFSNLEIMSICLFVM